MTYDNGFGLQAASWACRAAISASIAVLWLLDLDALDENVRFTPRAKLRKSGFMPFMIVDGIPIVANLVLASAWEHGNLLKYLAGCVRQYRCQNTHLRYLESLAA